MDEIRLDASEAAGTSMLEQVEREHIIRVLRETGGVVNIPPDTMRALVSWPWPGNVRELENFIERAVILSRGLH